MSRYDFADPSEDSDRCDALSIDPDEERWQDARAAADQAEAEAARAREFPQMQTKGAA